MVKKRIMVAVLALFLLLQTAGCADGAGKTTETASEAGGGETVSKAEETSVTDALADADYEGYTFRILSKSEDIAWGTVSYATDSEDGTVFNDTVYARNRAIEERYNVTITNTQTNEIVSAVSKFVSAGSDEYDFVSDYVKLTAASATAGYYVNLLSIPELDLSNPWWDSECAELLTIKDRLYVAFSDMNTQPLDLIACVFFNRSICETLGLALPYEDVTNGVWTMDRFYDMTVAAASDLNGDSVMDANDRFGFSVGIGSYNSWMNGAGQPHVILSDDGTMTLNYGSEGAVAAAAKIAKIFNDTSISAYVNEHSAWGDFKNGKSLFTEGSIGNYNTMRDADIDIGVLPTPKYDEVQKDYHSMMSNCSMGVTIPASVSDISRTAVIIEALGAYSYNTIRQAYYEMTLKDKLTQDTASAEMLDIIIGSRTVDVGVINEDTWGNIIKSFLTSIHKSGAEQLVSLAAKNEASFEAKLQDILDAYGELN